MRSFDKAMKSLVRAAAPDLFPLLGVRAPVKEWLSLELPAQNRYADLLARLESGILVHIELQARNDPKMALRMLEYHVRIFVETGVMPHQFVLYFGPKRLHMPRRIAGPGMHFEYTLIDVRRLNSSALLNSGIIEANLLALLTEDGDPEEVARTLRDRLRSTHDDERIRLEDLFLLLCSLRGHQGPEMLGMPIDAMDFPIIRESWESGRLEGKAEGKLEGMADVVTSVLASRFGPLPAWAIERLREASPEQLLRWSKSLFTAASLDALLRER